MHRYLYISYNTDKSLKDCQWYITLDEVKSERGITCNQQSLELARVGSWTSPNGSGCYLIDFHSNEIDFIDTNFSSHIMSLIPTVHRHLQIEKLGL
jgi:hypothetical protein